jgi:type III restriction enzyme
MIAFTPKGYQQAALDALADFFRACNNVPASRAFMQTTEELYGNSLPYHSLPGFPADMPYFCLRIPTGGGKTWLAAKSIWLVNSHLLRSEYSVILWLVPSDPIRAQTLAGLKDRGHPLHAALREVGAITVLTLEEAKSLPRSTLDTSTTVIVATRQAFQVENEAIRKVYENNGELMPHFSGLPAAVMNDLLRHKDNYGNDTVPYSLANALRLRRPFIIVDEAHNSRTELAFETLAKFKPSGIMELTATPDTQRTPSNVLYSVSAAELKAEEMIKLPIVLQIVPDWRQCLTDAIAQRDALQSVADKEWAPGGSSLRPIVLIQAEPKSATRETLTAAVIKNELLTNGRIPEEQIVVATGEEKGLDKIASAYPLGLADPACPVKYVITQKALAEGWDCPFAYILVSVASLQSSTAVEQLLGRILRQPDAKRLVNDDLNQSYAFVASSNFAATASALRDQLVLTAGFERKDVRDFVVAATQEQAKLDLEIPARRESVTVTLPQGATFSGIPKSLAGKVEWNKKANELTINTPLSEEEIEQVTSMVDDARIKTIIVDAAKAVADNIVFIQFPAELGYRVTVPQFSMLSLLNAKVRTVFDDPEEQLGVEWEFYKSDMEPEQKAIEALNERSAEIGQINITREGQMSVSFLGEVQQSLELVYPPENWDEVRLASWLCGNIPLPSLTHQMKMVFVLEWLNNLLRREDFPLARTIRQKSIIRSVLEQKLAEIRQAALEKTYQLTLFGPSARGKFFVDQSYVFEFSREYYPSSCYDVKRWGHYEFKKHFYRQIGDFDSKEELECACFLDNEAVKGNIKFWIRNLANRGFNLQKAFSRFYPDFICVLPDDRILVVEYKGADRWDTPKVIEDRKIGTLWAELSGGQCLFVMTKNEDWSPIIAEVNMGWK